MNETARSLLAMVGLLALAACADARGSRPSSPAPQAIIVATARDAGATSPNVAPPRVARSLGELGALVYEAVNDARWAGARALLDGYVDDTSCFDGSVQVWPLEGGGEMLVAARGLARSDASGKIVSHEVFTEGCVRYADPELTVLLRKDGVLVRTEDASHVLPHTSDEQTSVSDASVSISDAWVLVLDRDQDWLAVRRRDGKAVRGHHRVGSFGSEPPGATAGPFFLIRRDKELLLTNEDAKTVTVKGCPGLLRNQRQRRTAS